MNTFDNLDYLDRELLSDDAIILVGFNNCIVGIGSTFPHEHYVLIYCVNKIITELMRESEMDLDEANEYYVYNIAGLFAGPGTPIFMVDSMPLK